MTARFPPFAFVELVSPYNKKNITRWLEDTNFMFEWQEQYLTRSLRSLVRYCSCHSNIKFISSRHRVISSIYHYCVRCKHLRKWYTPKNGVDILHSYLPTTATSVKRPLSSVPRVAFVSHALAFVLTVFYHVIWSGYINCFNAAVPMLPLRVRDIDEKEEVISDLLER